MRTEHVKYDLMDYVTHQLSAQECNRVALHLQKCSKCNSQYIELLAADTVLKKNCNTTVPTPVYYSTILPRVRERLISHRRSIWDHGYSTAIILPLAVCILLMIFLIRMPIQTSSEDAQIEALHQAVKDLNEEEVVQAVEKEYAKSSPSPNQEVAAAGVAEHLQGDRFLKSAVSKQIENEEIADMDVEGMISDLDGEQVDQVLSGLSERNML